MTTYKHYKGELYSLICIATHSETNEKLVIYKDKHENIHARPYAMFFENVKINGIEVPRFSKVVGNKSTD
jgi:hypothetical protein